jgi:small subunit ribosomal protein S20
MPNIQSAKKKARQDKKRTTRNESYRKSVKNAIKALTGGKKVKVALQKAYSLIDKAAKKKVIHKNKAARMKARISKLTAKRK